MRTIGVVTVARSDYGIYLPILNRIKADPDLRLYLIVGGMHLSPEFGLTVKVIEADGFEIAERVEMLLSSDTPEGIAKSMGLGVEGFAQAYARFNPDVLLVLGDRFEMFAAAAAAVPFRIPMAHIHGGEITEGAIDDVFRHSITKMSHLHFASTSEYARRIIQMGEEPWRVTISGAPGLDNLLATKLLDRVELTARFGLDLREEQFLLATYHPVTLEYEKTAWQFSELLAALEEINFPVVFTSPNSDTGGRIILESIREFVKKHSNAQIVDNLGTQGYFSMMALAATMVGNSSSGIIEAASFKLPVVDVGNRQSGRIRAKNVINVGYEKFEICEGIKKAVSEKFHLGLKDLTNPYGDGLASKKIVTKIKEVETDERLLRKHFMNLDVVVESDIKC